MLKKNLWAVLATAGILLSALVAWGDDDAIMDVDNHSAAFVGNWGTSTAKILYYGDNYRYAWGCGDTCTTPTRTATFTTKQTADISGYYNVYVRHTTATNREETAQFKIYSVVSGTPTYRGTCYINQTQDGGEWLFCANVYLPNGSYGRVVLGNENTNPSEVVIADGVRFVRTGVDGGDILDGSVTGADISDSSITSTDIATGGVASVDILDNSVSSTDILNNSITSADIASYTITDDDIASNTILAWTVVDEPGIDYSNWGSHSYSGISTCNTYTDLTFIIVSAPAPGYIVVQANGTANNSIADNFWRVCLDDASGGNTCDGWSYIIEPANTNVYEFEKSWTLQHVYYVTGAGSKSIYLKTCHSEFANGNIMWNQVIGTYYPTRY